METDSLRIRSAYPGLWPVVVGVIIGWVGAALVGLLLQHIQYSFHKPTLSLKYSILMFASVQSALSGAVTVFLAERSERHQWRKYISAALWSTVCSYGGALAIGFVVATISYCVGYLGMAEGFTVPAFGAAAATALGVAGFIWALCMLLAIFLALGVPALPFALLGSTLGALGSGLLCRLADWPKAQSQ
jgi:hypothetical protein